MVQAARPHLIRLAPLVGGVTAGLIVALVAALLPSAYLEALIDGSGIAAIMPVAAPPLGVTARAVLALGGGVALAAVTGTVLYLLAGTGKPSPQSAADGPVVRRADAHPDAPPRRPFSTDDLPELAVPRDLDLPLAAFDPDALPPVPKEPVRAVKSLAPALAPPLLPGERLETFTLSLPPVTPAPMRLNEPASIDALLRRLEQGARRRGVAVAH